MIFMWMNEKRALELTDWFERNQRDLPWRKDPTPYHVWLSEIMLQQTRVEFVKDRYVRFLEELPDIQSLAECEEEKLLKLWEGMGYYSRIRNLQKCAKVLVKEHGGVLPSDLKTLLSLPGIGPYTAGAISSIAFHQPLAAVDGNVMRVMARVLADERDIRSADLKAEYTRMIQRFLDESAALITENNPLFVSSFTQALMELGALVCLPVGKAKCGVCPWRDSCRSFAEGRQETIPLPQKKKPRRIEKRTLLIIRDNDRFLMRKRSSEGLLAGLNEFIGTAGTLSKKQALQYVQNLGYEPLKISPLPDSRHIFTHVEWHMKAWEIRIGSSEENADQNLFWADKKELQNIAVPSAFHAYLEYYSLR